MIRLQPVTYENLCDFEDTAYHGMSADEKRSMIGESMRREHNGAYFELFAVCDGERVVGFMNLCAQSGQRISVGPEIKKALRRRGYGFLGETLALRYAKDAGYTTAVASVREDNPASIALHEKLGFEAEGRCLSQRGHPVRIYVRKL